MKAAIFRLILAFRVPDASSKEDNSVPRPSSSATLNAPFGYSGEDGKFTMGIEVNDI